MEEDRIKPAKIEAQNKIVKTYADDMAKIIESDKEGLIKKIIHGEEEHEAEKINLSPESKKNKIFMLVSILLIFLSSTTLSFIFFKEDMNTVSIEKQFTPIIFNDKSTFLEIAGFKKDEITQTVFNKVNTTEVKVGGVEGVYLTENKKIIGLRKFISLIKSSFTFDNNVFLVNDNFLIGAVNSENKDFFMLLKVRSTADIFNNLRSWEEKMLFDLHGFLGVNISSETNYLFKKDFEDGIIENKNARILYDKDGKPILMYIFADDNSIIITNSQNAADEIMLRLASSKAKK